MRQVLAAVLCTLALPLAAQQSLPAQPIPITDAAQLGQTFFQQSASTGMVLVVVRGHETFIGTYGETAPGSGQKPAANSELRLCSISKVFATDLLARLVANGTVTLNDPLQRYAPKGKSVPTFALGQPIRLIDLATHTSGLPREVSSYPRKTPHFTFPDYKLRWTWLQTQKPKTAPGTAALYSNIGFDFLGDALAAATHQTYATLLHDSLLEPLNMWDTTLAPSADQCARLLQGTGDQGACTDTQPSGASGGIYSTPTDMVKFLQYLLHIPGSPAQPAGALDIHLHPADLKSVQGLDHAGDPTGIGLAWIQLGDPATPTHILQKTGGGAGFGTYIAIDPERQTGIFLAITEGHGEPQIDFFHEANNLLAALANFPPLPPKIHIARRVKHYPKRRVPRTGTTPSTPPPAP